MYRNYISYPLRALCVILWPENANLTDNIVTPYTIRDNAAVHYHTQWTVLCWLSIICCERTAKGTSTGAIGTSVGGGGKCRYVKSIRLTKFDLVNRSFRVLNVHFIQMSVIYREKQRNNTRTYGIDILFEIIIHTYTRCPCRMKHCQKLLLLQYITSVSFAYTCMRIKIKKSYISAIV